MSELLPYPSQLFHSHIGMFYFYLSKQIVADQKDADQQQFLSSLHHLKNVSGDCVWMYMDWRHFPIAIQKADVEHNLLVFAPFCLWWNLWEQRHLAASLSSRILVGYKKPNWKVIRLNRWAHTVSFIDKYSQPKVFKTAPVIRRLEIDDFYLICGIWYATYHMWHMIRES